MFDNTNLEDTTKRSASLRERSDESRRRRSNRPGNSQANEPRDRLEDSEKRRLTSADGITFSGKDTEGAPVDQLEAEEVPCVASAKWAN